MLCNHLFFWLCVCTKRGRSCDVLTSMYVLLYCACLCMTHLYVITEYKTCMHAIVSESYINYSCTLSSIERLIIFHIYSVTRAACNDPRHNWRRGHMATTSGGGGTIPEAASVAAAAAPSRVALHGVIGSFDPAQEEWYEYAEMLTHYSHGSGSWYRRVG